MTKLAILQWPGVKREVHFVGFNRDHTACLICDEQNARQAITLRLPKAFDIRFRGNPVGEHGSPPMEIRRTALHLPACFSSQKEKVAFDDPNSMEVQTAKIFSDNLWKAVTRHKCWLEPKQDKKLSKLLRKELNRWRCLHAIRERETADQIAALPSGETKRPEELRNMLRGEFTTVTSGENGAFKSISIFDTTLDMLRHGWGGLREKLLEREWSEHFGLNLETIPTEAAAFHTWLEKRAYNAFQTTTDLNTRRVEIGVDLKLNPWQWEILKAAILYEIRFADGTRCWLDNIEERAVTDPREVEDFDNLQKAQQPPQPLAWHSEGFVTIRRCNGKRAEVETLPLSNEFRALCQLLAERPDQTAQFSEIEPLIGTRTHELDAAAKVRNPAQKGERRVRDLLRSETGRRLLEWEVLTEIKIGREKFLKFSPAKPSE